MSGSRRLWDTSESACIRWRPLRSGPAARSRRMPTCVEDASPHSVGGFAGAGAIGHHVEAESGRQDRGCNDPCRRRRWSGVRPCLDPTARLRRTLQPSGSPLQCPIVSKAAQNTFVAFVPFCSNPLRSPGLPAAACYPPLLEQQLLIDIHPRQRHPAPCRIGCTSVCFSIRSRASSRWTRFATHRWSHHRTICRVTAAGFHQCRRTVDPIDPAIVGRPFSA